MMRIQHDKVIQFYTKCCRIVLCCRVPQNCPRRYNLLAFDPDGDHVHADLDSDKTRSVESATNLLVFTLNQVKNKTCE